MNQELGQDPMRWVKITEASSFLSIDGTEFFFNDQQIFNPYSHATKFVHWHRRPLVCFKEELRRANGAN